MMMASMGITGCAKADGQTKEETKAVVVETPAGTETSATTENEATMLPGGENPEGTGAEAESEYAPFVGTVVSMENGELTMNRQVGDSTEEVIITISDDTKILDGVNGYPVEADRKSSERLCGTGDDNESAADRERDHDHHGCSGGRGVPEIYPGTEP